MTVEPISDAAPPRDSGGERSRRHAVIRPPARPGPVVLVSILLVAGYLLLIGGVLWRDYDRAVTEAEATGLNMVRLLEGLVARAVEDIEERLEHRPLSVDAEGAVVAGEAADALLMAEAIRTPLAIGDGGLAVAGPQRDRDDDWRFAFGRRQADGGVKGLWVSARQLSRMLELVQFPGFGTVGVNTLDGTLVLRHPYQSDQIGVRFDRSALFTEHLKRAPSGTGTIVFYTLDQSSRLVAFQTVRNAPLVVAVTRPWDEILAGWRNMVLLAAGAGLMIAVAVPIGLLMLMRVSQRAHAAEAARQAAEEADRFKSEFLARMSHELRTPLNAVLGYAEVIRDEVLGPAARAQYRRAAADIHQGGSHLLAVISEILDLAKMGAGQYAVHPEPVPVAALAARCEAMIRPVAERKKVHLDIELPPPGTTLFVDPHAATKILLNLLSNACKFSPPGGHVRLAFQAQPDGGMLVSVADNGLGMTATEVQVALSMFGQVDNPVTRREQGTGLGLPIVHNLVELHGGRLRIESEPGRGTTVFLDFPA